VGLLAAGGSRREINVGDGGTVPVSAGKGCLLKITAILGRRMVEDNSRRLKRGKKKNLLKTRDLSLSVLFCKVRREWQN